MKDKLVTKPAFTVVGIEIRTDNYQGQKDFPALWGKFYSENIEGQIAHRMDDEVVAMYTDYEGDHTKPFSFFIGCRVSKVEDLSSTPLVSRTVPAANYAAITAEGLFPQCLIDAWMKIWSTDLNRAYKADFEVYEPRQEEKCFMGDQKRVQIFVGLDI